MLSGKFKLIICNDRSCPIAFVLSGYKDEGGAKNKMFILLITVMRSEAGRGNWCVETEGDVTFVLMHPVYSLSARATAIEL